MSERKRNKFVVSKALINFVFAAVLTAAATQLAHTADSMNFEVVTKVMKVICH